MMALNGEGEGLLNGYSYPALRFRRLSLESPQYLLRLRVLYSTVDFTEPAAHTDLFSERYSHHPRPPTKLVYGNRMPIVLF